MILRTDRLALEDYTMDDISGYRELRSCAPVWRYSTFTPLADEAQAREALEKLIEASRKGSPVFGRLTLAATGEYIGEAGIIARNKEAARCTVGYNLLPRFWGNGYATEITTALVHCAFETQNVERVEALVQQKNVASRHVLEKSGLKLEGTMRHYAVIGGEYADICCYGLIADDYFKRDTRAV